MRSHANNLAAKKAGKPVRMASAKLDEKKQPAGWRYRFSAGAVAIMVSALLFLLLEIGLRVFGYGYPTDFFVKIRGRAAYTTNQKYGWRFFPPAIARTPVVSYVPAPKGPNTYRIFVLGESAAMGVPEPAFSFGQILRAMLRERYPGVRFEFVNAAMTAINSHVMLPIVADCARRKPDLFIIYAGNNEVVGPYGAGTVFTRYSPHLSLIRAGIWFKSTQTAQLLESAAAVLRKPDGGPRDWRGMAMFLDHLVAADDPRMERVYTNFAANLTDVCHTARRTGASVVLSTVPTNLKDSAPFASVHRRGLSEAERIRWQTIYSGAVEQVRASEYAKAADQFFQAARLDDRFAELHFHLARCLMALDRPKQAREHFILARDLDALRFRADTRINRTIREVAAKLAPNGIRLSETERAFEHNNKSQYGIPGDELFYEHVHPNFGGNYLIAKTVLQSIEADLPNWIKKTVDRTAFLSEDRAAELMTFTGWDRYRSVAEMFAMMGQPPFTGRFEYAARKTVRERQLVELSKRYTVRGALQEVQEAYLAALRREPEDMELRSRLAQLLSRCGDYAGAAEQWNTLTTRVPGVARWHTAFADVLRDQQKLDQALAQARYSLQLDPQVAAAHFSLGAIFERLGRFDEAELEYLEGLRMKPDYAEAHNHLAVILERRGQFREALAHYSEAVRLKSDFAEAHNNWGITLEGLGEIQQAIAHYSEALRLNPDFAEAQNNWGVALAKLGQIKAAVPHYREALKLKPDFAEAHNNWGVALEGLGEIQQAVPHYQEAVRLKPNFAEAQTDWGAALAKLGQITQAIPHYQEALRLKPKYVEARYDLGRALEELGRTREAIARYSEALRIRPDYTQVRSRLEAVLAHLEKSSASTAH